MKTKIFFPAIVILFFISGSLKPTFVSAQSTGDKQYENSVVVLPAISSSPETNLLLGGFGIYQFKLGAPSSNTRPSSIMVSGIYTLKDQISIGVTPSIFLENEQWMLNGLYSYSFFPESFWGVGSFTKESDEMVMISRQVYLEQSVLKQIFPQFFIGPQMRLINSQHTRFESPEGQILKNLQLTGAEDYTTLGMGFAIRWDTRNSIMFPTDNHLLSISIMTNPSWVSSLDSYTTYVFDGRKYVDISDKGSRVLALQIISKFSSGEPPVKDKAILGGQNILRGYYAGRLRDNHGAQLQAELRQHLYGRLGFSLFTSVGQIWSSHDNMNLDNSRVTAGGGFRFNINQKEQTNIRLDYGVGRNTSGLYLTIGEAF